MSALPDENKFCYRPIFMFDWLLRWLIFNLNMKIVFFANAHSRLVVYDVDIRKDSQILALKNDDFWFWYPNP